VHLICLVDGRDGSPMGVVQRGGVQIACSVERNRFKLHIIYNLTPPFSVINSLLSQSIKLEKASNRSLSADVQSH
jgi:hypothetical protein